MSCGISSTIEQEQEQEQAIEQDENPNLSVKRMLLEPETSDDQDYYILSFYRHGQTDEHETCFACWWEVGNYSPLRQKMIDFAEQQMKKHVNNIESFSRAIAVASEKPVCEHEFFNGEKSNFNFSFGVVQFSKLKLVEDIALKEKLTYRSYFNTENEEITLPIVDETIGNSSELMSLLRALEHGYQFYRDAPERLFENALWQYYWAARYQLTDAAFTSTQRAFDFHVCTTFYRLQEILNEIAQCSEGKLKLEPKLQQLFFPAVHVSSHHTLNNTVISSSSSIIDTKRITGIYITTEYANRDYFKLYMFSQKMMKTMREELRREDNEEFLKPVSKECINSFNIILQNINIIHEAMQYRSISLVYNQFAAIISSFAEGRFAVNNFLFLKFIKLFLNFNGLFLKVISRTNDKLNFDFCQAERDLFTSFNDKAFSRDHKYSRFYTYMCSQISQCRKDFRFVLAKILLYTTYYIGVILSMIHPYLRVKLGEEDLEKKCLALILEVAIVFNTTLMADNGLTREDILRKECIRSVPDSLVLLKYNSNIVDQKKRLAFVPSSSSLSFSSSSSSSPTDDTTKNSSSCVIS